MIKTQYGGGYDTHVLLESSIIHKEHKN